MMPDTLEKLIHYLSKLPGIGEKSAKRFALYLLQNQDQIMIPLSESLREAATNLIKCNICGNFDDNDICYICSDEKRDKDTICVVENLSDLWALEDSKIYRGQYHILWGNLSSFRTQNPESLNIEKLIKRVKENNISEVIIATNSSIDGQTTAFYITEKLEGIPTKITRLANGIPIGGDLNYLDPGTIAASFTSRRDFS